MMLLTLFTVAFTSTVPTSYDGATTVQVVVDVQLTLRARAAGIFAFEISRDVQLGFGWELKAVGKNADDGEDLVVDLEVKLGEIR